MFEYSSLVGWPLSFQNTHYVKSAGTLLDFSLESHKSSESQKQTEDPEYIHPLWYLFEHEWTDKEESLLWPSSSLQYYLLLPNNVKLECLSNFIVGGRA